jgi:hypothetical protein
MNAHATQLTNAKATQLTKSRGDYLRLDDPTNTTFQNVGINENSHGGVIVQFTSGAGFNDKEALAAMDFAYDKHEDVYLRIWIDTDVTVAFSSLLKTHALQYCYIKHDAETMICSDLYGHCGIKQRCFLHPEVLRKISAILLRERFQWHSKAKLWGKKMSVQSFQKQFGSTALSGVQPQLIAGPEYRSLQNTKIQKLQESRNKDTRQAIQWDNYNWAWQEKRMLHNYRLRMASSDPVYQRASFEYGQLIKAMATAGDYNYPPPPELPTYPLPA